MSTKSCVASAIALCLLGTSTSFAQDSYAGPLTIKLLAPLSTRVNQKNDKVVGTVVSPSEFGGGIVEGQITELKSGKGGSSLNLTFRALDHGGRQYLLTSEITGFQNSKGQVDVDDEGRVVKRQRVTKKKALIMGAIGGAAGAALGGAQGAVIGAAAGVGAAIIMRVAVKGPSVSFETNSLVMMKARVRPLKK